MGKQRKKNDSQGCPCGGVSLAACCGKFHEGQAAPDAETLMRSRYSAYVLGLEDYLLSTWHESTRPASITTPGEPAVKWLGLAVERHGGLQDPDAQAFVEFVAKYKPASGPAQKMHERSRFCFEGGRWYYLDGKVS